MPMVSYGLDCRACVISSDSDTHQLCTGMYAGKWRDYDQREWKEVNGVLQPRDADDDSICGSKASEKKQPDDGMAVGCKGDGGSENKGCKWNHDCEDSYTSGQKDNKYWKLYDNASCGACCDEFSGTKLVYSCKASDKVCQHMLCIDCYSKKFNLSNTRNNRRQKIGS